MVFEYRGEMGKFFDAEVRVYDLFRQMQTLCRLGAQQVDSCGKTTENSLSDTIEIACLLREKLTSIDRELGELGEAISQVSAQRFSS